MELDLGYDFINSTDFGLSGSVNWSTNENEVTDLYGTESINLSPGASVSSRAVVGYPLGALYGTSSQTNPDGSFILNSNGFPQITSSPEVLGDPNPDWRGGVSLNMRYKNWRLNAVLEHSEGGLFSPRTLWVLHRFGTTQETANRMTLDQNLVNYAGNTIAAGTTVRGRVRDFGGGPVLLDESWYRTGIGGGFGDNQAYNFAVVDATWTKLRDITLSYVLDSPSIKKIGLSDVMLSFSGRDLININKVEGIDPEINTIGVSTAQGVEYFTNPQTKGFLFSLTINLSLIHISEPRD